MKPFITATKLPSARRTALLVIVLLSTSLTHVTPMAATPQIVSADGNNCLLRQDGRVSCWGYPDNGVNSPPAGPFEQISVGGFSACGLRANGHVECWGGLNTTLTGLTNVPEGTYLQVDAGDYLNCAVRSDRKIVCWGDQVGGVMIPYTEDTDQFSKVRAGWANFCALRTNGELACGAYSPPPPPAGAFIDIATDDTGQGAYCAIRSDGQIVCWGNNAHGEGSPPPGQFSAAGMGLYHACGIKQDRTITCWGYFGNQDYHQYFPPAGQYSSLGVGSLHNCALRIDGVTVCWGTAGSGTPWLVIQPKAVLAAEVGIPYRATLSMIDGGSIFSAGSYIPVDPIIAIVTGTLPPGFSLAANGELTGTATETGQWPVTVLAQEDNGYEVLRDVEFTVVQPGEDVTPPLIAPVITGLKEWADWYRSDVTIEWNVSDPESGATSQVGCQTIVIDNDTPRRGSRFDCSAKSTGGVAMETIMLRRDATPPVVQITSVEALEEEGYYRLNFSGSDAVSDIAFYQCSVDDLGFAFCRNWDSEVFGPLSPGPHTLHVRAADNAGNYSMPLDYPIGGGGDSSAPVIVSNVTGPLGNNGWYVGDVSIDWTLSDPESAITSSIGCVFTSVTGDTGAAAFTCRATSDGGTAEQTLTVKRDATAPDTTLTSTPGNPSTQPAANFGFTGSDGLAGVAGYACSLDGGAFNACTSPLTTGALANGLHTFTVRSIDAAGNVDGSPATHSWSVVSTDIVGPSASPVMSKAPNANNWYAANVTVTWNWTDAGSGIDRNQCTTRTTSAGEGIYLLSASCRDLAGNIGNASVQVRIDMTAPQIPPFVYPQIVLRAVFTTTPEMTDSLSGIATRGCDPVVTSAVGNFTTTCKATDLAGNSTVAKRPYSVVYGLAHYNAPVLAAPAVNLVTASTVIPLRWRLVDANGAPVTNLKSAEVGTLRETTGASFCSNGTPQPITETTTLKKLVNLGNGNYELAWSVGKSSGTCIFLSLLPPIQGVRTVFRIVP